MIEFIVSLAVALATLVVQPTANVEPPNQLHVVGVDQQRCDDMGGQFVDEICLDVDY